MKSIHINIHHRLFFVLKFEPWQLNIGGYIWRNKILGLDQSATAAIIIVMNADLEHAFGNLIISKCLVRREAEKAYYFYKAMNSYAICKERKELLRRDKSMKLSRTDYALMKVLKSHNCTTYFSGMTMQEIMSVLGISRSSAYRKLNSLIFEGYIEKAC